MKTNSIKVITLMLLGVLIIGACGKKRKGEDDVSKTRLFFHNLTSKYNGYFNADELMYFSEVELATMHADNYSKILDVYDYVDVDNPKSVAADLDKAIEKVGTVASLHRPSHWLDDCYVLMGKAQYLKHDYESAEETFEFFEEEFDPKNPFGSNFKSKKKSKKQLAKERKKKQKEKQQAAEDKREERKKERKKKSKKNSKTNGRKLTKREKADIADKERLEEEAKSKKKRENKKSSDTKGDKEVEKTDEEKKKDDAQNPKFYEHKPAYNEGLLWLAKTYIARKKFSTANSVLRRIQNNKFYKGENLEKEMAITKADLFLKQKNYNKAIPFLSAAIQLTKKKKDKARYSFIIAQVYEHLDQYAEANNYYRQVVKMHPHYEMEFNANLKMLNTDYLSGLAPETQVVSKIEKMLKEDKNFDYRDQLYYTLGEIELKKTNLPGAIINFRKSVQANTTNNTQKIESYYVLAELYYNSEDYYNASMYYDSTKTNMDKLDERYSKVEKYASNLGEIAIHIKTVKLQDSLLAIANLSEEELNDYAKKIIEKERAAKEAMNKTSQGVGRPGGPKNVVSSTRFGSKPSTFFAYHPQQVIKGIDEFQEKWGDRELEDNWRRSNKFEVGDDSEDEEYGGSRDSDEISDAELKRALKNVPLKVGDKINANTKIEKALHRLGILYREKLENCTKSTEALQRLLIDYPESKNRAEACYLLYVCNLDTDATLATHYANIVKSDYPDSKYAKFLLDPGYMDNFLSLDAQAGKYYDQTYDLFNNANYQGARSNILAVDSLYGKKNKYAPKFALLDAMTQGHLVDKEAYVKALKTVVSKYPNTPEKTRAQEILRFLKGDKFAFNEGLANEDIENFVLQDSRMHYIIVKVNEKKDKAETDQLKLKISAFNKQYFKLDKLKIKDSYLDIQSRTSIILIRRFSNREKAMVYYDTVMKNRSDFMGASVEFEIFAVTQRNYREVLKQKSTNSYKKFFEGNYL